MSSLKNTILIERSKLQNDLYILKLNAQIDKSSKQYYELLLGVYKYIKRCQKIDRKNVHQTFVLLPPRRKGTKARTEVRVRLG